MPAITVVSWNNSLRCVPACHYMGGGFELGTLPCHCLLDKLPFSNRFLAIYLIPSSSIRLFHPQPLYGTDSLHIPFSTLCLYTIYLHLITRVSTTPFYLLLLIGVDACNVPVWRRWAVLVGRHSVYACAAFCMQIVSTCTTNCNWEVRLSP
jgi:hypothetical protein